MAVVVDFQPIGRRGLCSDGQTLLDAARGLGVDLSSVCGGNGSCGRCKVQLIAGELTPLTAKEKTKLTAAELVQGYRLACLAAPLSDCRVHVPAESLTAPQRTQVEGLEAPTALEPAVTGYMIAAAGPTLDDPRGDDQRLCDAVAAVGGRAIVLTDLAVARHATETLRRLDWQARVTVRGHEIIHVAPADAPWLGLAVDIGTTKIAAYLVDLTSGRTLAAAGAMNPQIAYGEDVVARLMYADKGPNEAAALQALLAESLNRLAADLAVEIGARPADIVDAVAVGNTAIHHLFLRLPVHQLAAAPYVPAVRSAVDVKAREIGLQLAPGAYVHLLPNIAGYVGADHVAMLLATGVADATDTVLALDIGTNTEICLAQRGRLTSLSCASGPAFEGAHISFGMRAAPGAIERVQIVDGRVAYKTIGDAPPVGLCGSGILDAMAQLRLAGLLDRRGALAGPAVGTFEGDPAFVIAEATATGNGRPIVVTQHDIRELQLAKAAIRCGIETLLQDAGIGPADLERVIIAGAFGTYIDVESALTIGLLPPMPRDRIVQVGNAAGTGARLALISRHQRARAAEVAGRTRYLELARAPRFMRNFAEAMYL